MITQLDMNKVIRVINVLLDDVRHRFHALAAPYLSDREFPHHSWTNDQLVSKGGVQVLERATMMGDTPRIAVEDSDVDRDQALAVECHGLRGYHMPLKGVDFLGSEVTCDPTDFVEFA
jgi:hypothetical protein